MSEKIYVIHENDEWTKPLIDALEELNVPYEDWFINEGNVDLSEEPPKGIFYNRMSASSHSRGHRYAPELTMAVLSWLEGHGRTVLNGSHALDLEVNKARQYSALESHGIKTPKTVVTVGKESLIQAAEKMDKPFITKHNRAGKGLGVQLFHSVEALEAYVNSSEFEEPIDGVTLLQQYIQSEDSTITRCEFVDGQFLYAVRVDTSEGFELCPADACTIDDNFCLTTENTKEKFKIIPDFKDPIIDQYESFLKAHNINFAGIEFIRDEQGQLYTYDINTNTNYNADAESKVQLYGMKEVARALANKLEKTLV
ncbi:ATP-grasp domain-containing protein [Piscibacillus halophilus]|uniref:Glutathione synthase/RimK-type ligase, ATP-grasp superfamily n=1 Tax=Piscibacillus halophilus TaxID=571933 RepID=A0A1H9JQX0_9BACI|nr:alpha-L-glutamate ligase [Piscibacillus halophilus]SEQ89234.1 Glutathione synthase/RimK-type ligase, ATP-grasp superfamily [Piscibacillus halophilus]